MERKLSFVEHAMKNAESINEAAPKNLKQLINAFDRAYDSGKADELEDYITDDGGWSGIPLKIAYKYVDQKAIEDIAKKDGFVDIDSKAKTLTLTAE